MESPIAQYLAGIILRNEVNYTEKLVTPTPAPSPTLSPTVTEKPDNIYLQNPSSELYLY